MPVNAGTSPRSAFVLGLVWAAVARGGAAASGLIGAALLTRMLPAEQVGIFFIASATALLVGPLASLSLREPTVQSIAAALAVGDRAKASAVARGALKLGTVSAVILAAGFCSVWWLAIRLGWVAERAQLAVGFGLAAWIAIIAIENLLVATLQGLEDIRRAVILDGTLGKILAMVAMTLLWAMRAHTTLVFVLAIYVICELISTVLAARRVMQSLRELGSTAVVASASDLWRTTWPFLVHQITANLAAQADVMVLGLFRSPTDVAFYGTAARLASLPALPVAALNIPIAPSVARLSAQRRMSELQALLQGSAAGFTAIAVVAAIVWGTEGRFLLGTLFGPAYRSGIQVLMIMGVGQCLNLFFGQCMIALAMTGSQRILTQIAVLSSVLKIALIFAGAYFFGSVGVAAAAMVGNTIALLAGWRTAHRRLGIYTHAHLRALRKAVR